MTTFRPAPMPSAIMSRSWSIREDACRLKRCSGGPRAGRIARNAFTGAADGAAAIESAGDAEAIQTYPSPYCVAIYIGDLALSPSFIRNRLTRKSMLRSDEPDSDGAISSSRRLRRMRRRGCRVNASNSARSFLVNCIVSPSRRAKRHVSSRTRAPKQRSRALPIARSTETHRPNGQSKESWGKSGDTTTACDAGAQVPKCVSEKHRGV